MILVVNMCKEKMHELEFVKPIEDILRKSNKKFITKHYKKLKKGDINNAKKIIICGTSLKDNEFLKNLDRFNWIKDFKRPILGICGGSHVIGLALGYKLKKKKEIGLKEINIDKEFLGINGNISVYHLHGLLVLPEVYQKDNLYATIFHPEVRNKKIIEEFLKV
ncbi:hypothetical protein HY448_00845 [Candidatus Pacearchaeota archaeon]|nr:hypothetical protein [Candidatus Pacearchaeota archaeon]